MSDTGFRSPSTVVNDATVGSDNDWTNPGNASASDNSYATIVINLGVTNYLKATDFGFTIPENATINGIEVSVEEKSSVGSQGSEQYVKIVKGGIIGGNDISAHNALTTSDIYQASGGATELAGLSFAYTDINASTFGCVVNYTQSAGQTISVDHIRMKVYYTEYTPPATPIVGLKYPIPPFKKA